MRRASRWRLLALLALFLGLTAAGLAAAAWVAGESGRSVWALATTLDRGTLGGACALAVGLLVADIARFWLAGRLIQAPISWRAATDASIASSFFAWVTPGSALAEPATIVALTRHRAISADVAATLTLTKTMTSLVILMTTCAAVLVSGWGPALPWPLYAPLVTGTSVLGVVGACLLGASSRPGLLLGPLDAGADAGHA